MSAFSAEAGEGPRQVPSVIAVARQRAAERSLVEEDGGAIAAGFAEAVDGWLVERIAAAVSDAPEAPPITVLAVGGYGRGELTPGSDIDLLFLTDAIEDAGGAAAVIEPVLRALWDCGFQVGYAVRTVAECVTLADADLSVATGLFTARHLAGERERAHALRAAVAGHFSGDRADALLNAISDGMEKRHARYGGSVYLLEPNLKQSPGGLRDLAVVWWTAAVAFGLREWSELVARGVISPPAARALHLARGFLLRVRIALQSMLPYGGDRLTFGAQQQIAAALGYGADGSAVERFMAAHYRHASAVKKWSRLVTERCIAQGARARPRDHRILDADFAVVDGLVAFRAPARVTAEPYLAARLFAIARREGVGVHGTAEERVSELAGELGRTPGFREDPRVIADFLSVLATPHDPADALGALHEAELLGAIVPEFGAVTHRTHHDLYHVYTVDIHTLHAVRRLKALHLGEMATEEPLLTSAIRAVRDPEVLYLALLMHDAGKAQGRGHAVIGARLAEDVSRRFGWSAERVRATAWLVRDHLLMAHLSQRRDLSDPALIQQFCRTVVDEERLAMLFILTWADASTTGPQAYTDWKAALLHELYAAALQRFRLGLSALFTPDQRVAELRDRVTRALARRGDARVTDVNGAVDRFFSALPTGYFKRVTARDVRRHLELLEAIGPDEPVALSVVPRPRRACTYLHLASAEQPGLMALVAGVLAAHALDVIGADLNATTDGRSVDIFRVRDAAAGDAPAGDDPRWALVQRDLRAVLRGEVAVEDLIEAAYPTAGRFAWPPGPPVETGVEIIEGVGEGISLLEVRTRDRPQLLFHIVRAIEQAGARIAFARISTEGDAVHDSFYLTGIRGASIDAEDAVAVQCAVRRAMEVGAETDVATSPEGAS